jgi:hypothetical protein
MTLAERALLTVHKSTDSALKRCGLMCLFNAVAVETASRLT